MSQKHAPIPTKPVDYGEIRNQVKDGDVILFGGVGLLSSWIEHETQGSFSHAALCCWWDGRLMLLQAEVAGLQAVPLSSFVADYEGRTDWWALTSEARAKVNIQRVLWEAKSVLGRPYGYWKLIEMASHLMFRTRIPKEQKDPSSMVCAEFVSHCYRAGGMPICAHTDINTSPTEIAVSGLFVQGGTIRHDPKLKPNDRDDQIRLQQIGLQHGAIRHESERVEVASDPDEQPPLRREG